MSQDDLMKRSGARWCEVHSRWECTAAKPGGCHAFAIRGLDKCRHHAGRTTEVAKTLGEARLLAWSTEAEGAAEAGALDPGQVVMSQLRVAVIRADLYGELLRLAVTVDGDGALVGPTYAAGRDGGRVETGEQQRALSRLEAEWRDRSVRFAKVAHDMGIAERAVELAAAQAAIVVAAARAGMDALGLVPGDRDEFLRAFLGALGGGGAPPVVAGELEGSPT